jgi:hypothetical protein
MGGNGTGAGAGAGLWARQSLAGKKAATLNKARQRTIVDFILHTAMANLPPSVQPPHCGAGAKIIGIVLVM